MAELGEIIDSPSPVMTFESAGLWLAVKLPQLERIATTTHLWPVPLASDLHLGLHDDHESLLPILTAAPPSRALADAPRGGAPIMFAVVRSGDRTFGLRIHRAGKVQHEYRPLDEQRASALPRPALPGVAMLGDGEPFWLLDIDDIEESLQGNHLKRIH